MATAHAIRPTEQHLEISFFSAASASAHQQQYQPNPMLQRPRLSVLPFDHLTFSWLPGRPSLPAPTILLPTSTDFWQPGTGSTAGCTRSIWHSIQQVELRRPTVMLLDACMHNASCSRCPARLGRPQLLDSGYEHIYTFGKPLRIPYCFCRSVGCHSDPDLVPFLTALG